MKKRLLIVSHALELGGAERSLIGLLDALDPQVWEIDLFLLRHTGELMDAIPAHVQLLPQVSAYTVLARPMKDTLREGKFLLTGARMLGKIAARRYNQTHGYTDSGVGIEYSHKFTCPLMPKIRCRGFVSLLRKIVPLLIQLLEYQWTETVFSVFRSRPVGSS